MNADRLMAASAPVLSCAEAREFEARRLGGDEEREWVAMRQAGQGVARGVVEDFEEIGGLPAAARVLVIVGKGHNGGDALLAAATILEGKPQARAEVLFAFGERSVRPLVARAWRSLSDGACRGRVRTVSPESLGGSYDLCLDGLFGFRFRPPVDARIGALLQKVNALAIRLRAAVDLPSAGVFRADFTYATGAVKEPVLAQPQAGRIRYLDLGFFAGADPGPTATQRVLTTAVLAPLAALRPAACDKRSYGHLFLLGGSRSYPGAVLMATLAAVRAGTGLVTAFVPESLVAAYAARLPEAMWVGWPETPAGGLALEGLYLLRERLSRASAVLLGPGMAREPETLALAQEVVRSLEIPVLIDADALQVDTVAAAKGPLVVTPHAGEFARIAGGAALADFAARTGATVVLKGPVTRIASGAKERGYAGGGAPVTHLSFFGGPVLARGGSGDLLSGLIGGLLAQEPKTPELAAARGAVWHGLAADLLARAKGQVAVHTTELLDHLGPALRTLE